MVYRGLAKHCKRSRWFELACLVEQAEFELRCGLKAAMARTAAHWKDLWLRLETSGVQSLCRDVVLHCNAEPATLLVPVPGQLFCRLFQIQLRGLASLEHRRHQVWGEKRGTARLTQRSLLPSDLAIMRSKETSPLSSCSRH